MKYRNKKLLSKTLAFMLASLMLVSTGLTAYASSMEGTGTLSISVGEPEDETDEIVSVGEPEDDGVDETEDDEDVIPTEEPADEVDDDSISDEEPVDGTDDDNTSVEEPVTDATPAPSEEPVIIQGPDGEDYVITVEDPAADEQEPEMPSYTLTGTAGDRTVSFTSGTGFAPGTELNVTAMDAEALDAAVSGLNGTLAGKEASGVFGFTYEISGYEWDVDIVLDAGLEEGLALFDGEEYSELVYDNGFVGRPSGSVFCVALSDVKMGPVEYACEGDGFSVSAIVQPEAGISENAILCAEKLDGYARQAAFDAVKEGLGLTDGTELWFEPYDVYFLDGENRIEPVDGLVQVTMSFSQAPFAEIEADKEFIAHILDSGEVEEIATEDSGEAMTFSVGSFSVMGPAAVVYAEDDIVTPATDTEGAYAILYEDGTLVMQRGNAIHSAHGEVIGGPWTGFEDGYFSSKKNVPWNSFDDNIKSISVIDAIHPTSTSYWFYGLNSLLSIDLRLLNTSSVTSMAWMFSHCTSLVSVDLSSFDTSSVTDMYEMFYDCQSLTSLDLSCFNTSAVTRMTNMFGNCCALSELDMSSFDTSSVKSMYGMFRNCKSLGILNLQSFDTSAVTTMCYMFYNCQSLTSLDLSCFDTSSVTDMSRMFCGCNSLSELDLSFFDTSVVSNMRRMFYGCSKLLDLNISNFSFNAGTSISDMFLECHAVQRVTARNVHSYVLPYLIFNRLSGTLESMDLSGWVFDDNLTTMSSAFYGFTQLKDLNLDGWDTSRITDMHCMFQDCRKLESLDISSFDTSHVTLMYGMFDRCGSLKAIDLSSFDTSCVTDMSNMFFQCSSLSELNCSGFDMSACINVSSMFQNCYSLKKLYIANFDFSKFDNCMNIFQGLNALTEFHAKNCKFFIHQFSSSDNMYLVVPYQYDEYCCFSFDSILELLDLSDCMLVNADDGSFAVDIHDLFSNYPNLRELDLTGVTTNNIMNMIGLFNGLLNLKKLTLDKDFHFIEGQNAGLQPNWMNAKTGVIYENLQESYTGGDMAGTYVREGAIMFDTIYDGKKSVSGYLDRPATLPDDPYIKGRTFLGWFTEKTGGKQLKAGDILTQLAYYAHYRDWEYDLVIDPNGGDGDRQTHHLSWNNSQKLPGNIYSYPDKVFAGWNTRKDGSGKAYSGNDTVRRLASSDGDTVTLYAQWTDPDDTVTIIFDTQGGTEVPSMEAVRGSDAEIYMNYASDKEHYKFLGWWFNANGKEPDTNTTSEVISKYAEMGIEFDSSNITQSVYGNCYNIRQFVLSPEFCGDDLIMYAIWLPNIVVTFDMNDDNSRTFIKEYDPYAMFGMLPDYSSDSGRISFIGWFTHPNGGDKITPDTKVGYVNRTVYAHWGWRPVFDTAGGVIQGKFDPEWHESPNYVITELPDIVRDGYTFDGWYYGDRQLQEGDVIDLTQPLDIIAHWTAKQQITITFKADRQTNKMFHGYAGEPFHTFPTLTSYPSKFVSGYGTVYAEFLGWKDENGNYRNPGDIFDKDAVLTADFIYPECILTFDPDGGSSVSGTKINSNKTVIPKGMTLWSLPGAKKTNCILEGWYTEKEGQGEKLTIETVHEESRTYYAHWIPFYLNADDANSLYVYGAEWSNASNSNVSNQGDNLDVHPSSNSSINASLHVRFELNKSIGDAVLPVGSVKIKVPGYIWKDWDGNNTGSNNISTNFPQYPAVRNGMWFSYQKDGDDYILINSKELSGSAGLDFTINYSVMPRNVSGGAMDHISQRYIDGYDFYKGQVPVQFSVDANLDGINETDVSKELSVEMHTYVYGSITKKFDHVFYKWPSKLGDEPVDADDYFYIRWYVQCAVVSGAQQSKNYGDIIEGFHSGSIVYTDMNYVYTKHLISDLLESGSSGLALYNECYRNLEWKSGYVERLSSIASTTMYVNQYPTGEYGKKNDSGNSTTIRQISGGQEIILDDDKVIAPMWYIRYNGGSNMEPVWNESNQTYSLPERTIRIRDGMPGDVTYSSGSASRPYVWEPDTGNTILSDDDYYFDRIHIEIIDYDGYFNDSGWHMGNKRPRDSINNPKLYVRYAGSSEYVYYSDIDLDSNGLDFFTFYSRTKVVGFELRYNTDSYKTNIYVYFDMYLKPTEHVKALLQDDVDLKKSSVIKNSSTCDIWTTALGEEDGLFFHVTDNTGGNTAANKNCYNLTVSNTYQYTKKSAASQSQVIFDVERGTQDDRMYIGTWNYNNGSRKKKLNTGTFYDLLPTGTSVDPSTLTGYYTTANNVSSSSWYQTTTNNIDKGWYDVRFESNWENSGRTMMIIKVAVPEQYKSTGISFSYMLHNTYENVMEHGTTVENDVAFVDNTENRVPPYSVSGTLNTITDKMYYQGLEDAYAGKITYAKANTNYIPVDAYSWGFDKSVQSISEYAHEATVLPNTSYTYRLAYSQSEYAISSKLVFFDILEGGFDGNESQWHGIFHSVNAESASSKLTDGSTSVYCQPVVYYSTKAQDSFTGEDFDVTKRDVWSTTCPYDKSKVTAIAVDCSKNTDGTDFVMKGKQALEVYITMRAPKDAGNVGKTAYNEGVLWAVHGEDENPTPEYSDASTTIEDVDPEIHKSSTPESGTESRPTLVYQDDVMSYHLSVTNPSEEFTLNDIVVEDTIPVGLRADDTNLMVHFGNAENALPVMKSPRVDFRRSGQKLIFTISSLLPGETVYFDIPCDVLAKEGILENTAYITSINGIEKHFESETTWHEAQPTGMAVLKTGAFGNALPGARMQLLDDAGKVVHEWTSTDKTYHMEVKAGTYTVHEAEAPVGHFLAEDITVVLTRQGDMLVDNEKVSPLVMDDDYTKVSVAKTDMDGNLIGGAKLAIYRPSDFEANELKDGAVPVLEWESVEGEAKELFGQLQQGEEYVLYESQAPEGLVTADPVWFTVNADGAAQTVAMVDYPEGRQVLISKKDVEGNMLPGAELTLTGPEGFEAISWTSTDAPKLFVLPAGEYVLHETQAPTGYKLAEDVRFTVVLDAEDALAVIMEDPYEAHDLSVGKTVAGNMGDKTKAFSFSLMLDKDLGTLAYVKNGETGSLEPEEDGSYLFTLAHGETITFQGIRYGTGYTVMETGSDGYTVEVSGDNASGTITEADVTVSFINTRNEGMPTGFVAFTGISGALALAAGSGWIMLAKRRKKRQGDDLEFLDDV